MTSAANVVGDADARSEAALIAQQEQGGLDALRAATGDTSSAARAAFEAALQVLTEYQQRQEQNVSRMTQN